MLKKSLENCLKISKKKCSIYYDEINCFSSYIVTVLEFLNPLAICELSFLYAVSYKKTGIFSNRQN